MSVFAFALLLAAISAASAGRYTGPTIQEGLDIIKEFEGWHSNFYTNPVGIRTIGYGHVCHLWDCTVPLNEMYSVPLTLADGQSILKEDLSYSTRYEGCINNNVHYNLNPPQFSALASFIFSIGCDNFASSDIVQLINEGDIFGASQEFGKWVFAPGQISHGLIQRRLAERELFCKGMDGLCDVRCIGLVTRDGGVNIMSAPHNDAGIVGSLREGASTYIHNRTTGTPVQGNPYWFNVWTGFVPAYYIRISDAQPCVLLK